MLKFILPILFCLSANASIFSSSAELENRDKPKISKQDRVRFLKLIETEVDPMFVKMAKSFLESNPVKEVRMFKNHVVFDVDTKGMYFRVTQTVDDKEYIQQKYLENITSIPFPRPGDIVDVDGFVQFGYNFSILRGEFGLYMPAYEVQDGKQLELYFIDMKWGGIFKPNGQVSFGFVINDDGVTTFNSKNYFMTRPNQRSSISDMQLLY